MIMEAARKAPLYTHIPLLGQLRVEGKHGFFQEQRYVEVPTLILTQTQDTLAQIQHRPEIVNNRILRSMVSKVEKTMLPVAIQGFYDGIVLALQHFSWETHPKVTAVYRNYAEKEVNSIPVEYDAEDDTILLYILPVLTFCNSVDYIQEVLHDAGIYISKEQALMNIYMKFGIHEAIHFLQAHHAEGLHHIQKDTIAANFADDPEGYAQDIFEIEAFSYADMLAGQKDSFDVMRLIEEHQAMRNKRQIS